MIYSGHLYTCANSGAVASTVFFYVVGAGLVYAVAAVVLCDSALVVLGDFTAVVCCDLATYLFASLSSRQ